MFDNFFKPKHQASLTSALLASIDWISSSAWLCQGHIAETIWSELLQNIDCPGGRQ